MKEKTGDVRTISLFSLPFVMVYSYIGNSPIKITQIEIK